MYVCLYVRTITVERNDLLPRYFEYYVPYVRNVFMFEAKRLFNISKLSF